MKLTWAPIVSGILHLAAAVAIVRGPARTPPPPPTVRLQVAVVEKARPPPPAQKVNPPPPRPRPLIANQHKPVPRPPRPAVSLARTETALPPPSKEVVQQRSEEPAALGGISLASTSASGSFAVAVGNTLSSAPPRVAPAAAKAKPYKAERYAPAAELGELPEVLNRDQVDIRRHYPRAALQRGREGEVVLRLTIDADGSIAEASVVKDPGDGMGAAALEAVRQFRFAPGRLAGTPVATTIPFVIRFVLS